MSNSTSLHNTRAVAPNASNSAAAASFAALTDALAYLNPHEFEQVKKAYRFADEAHLGQMRNNGEPYITHPIAVAQQCASWKLDAAALMAALLHDVIEDSRVTKVLVAEHFGAVVADLVDGLTKLEKIEFISREENQAESFRKMLLAMAKDVRVILIKLADRSHNMRTLSDVPRQKWARIATETLQVYAPIAYRLGMNQTYQELQDLCIKHLKPWRYQILTKAIAKARTVRKDLIEEVSAQLQKAFTAAGLNVRILGREKSLYSVYKKMGQKRLGFADVTDIYGFRIVVHDLIQCYAVLGVLHQLYQPVPGKFKDYIAIPKANGYQSLHTTLVGPSAVNIEFQMRTPEMDRVAEDGVAAHWLYKSHINANSLESGPGNKWIQSLLDIQKETGDTAEFWDHVKLDLFPDSVYVFTPKSKILALPRGATALDFAYAIHSNVGQHAESAKVNGKTVALKTELLNGNTVEIVTSSEVNPTPAWMTYANTARARSKIRNYLKQSASVEAMQLGERMLTQALRAEGFAALPTHFEDGQLLWDKLLRFTGNRDAQELLTDIGLGRRIASIVVKRLVTLMIETGAKRDPLLVSRERFNSEDNGFDNIVTLDGSEGASVQFSTCCRPVPGDAILGYLGHGEGLQIHRRGCALAERMAKKNKERFVDVEWSDQIHRLFESALYVIVRNGKGVLATVASRLASAEVDISHIDMGQEHAQDTTDLKFIVAVRDRQHLTTAVQSLLNTACVISAHGQSLPLPR